MASIDNKVVSITFDNSNFERNVQQTLQTLATLKSSLDFKGAGDSLSEVSAAASKFSLSGMADAVESISSKFSAMGAVAFSVINNITSRAVDMAVTLGKQFTIDPLTDGFAEFELKMGSIQTIMSGSGESLEVVNQKLEELNRYSDQTIYSFADMTQNIGKFTNAGLDLDTSVASIQGIANVAAISGANAEEASRAMYNFAQSLSAGSVKLMDWKSIENANMATAGFKTEILESAVAAGTLTKDVDGLYSTLEGTPVSATKGFNESLTEQWLTTEVLNETLGRYADETTEIGAKATAAASDIKTFSQMMDTLKESAGSGWAVTFETIFGDFEEGKALWTELGESMSDIIGNSAEARNAVLADWKDQGGRTMLIDALREGFQNLAALAKPIQEAFRTIFPRKTGDDLIRMTEAFAKFTAALKPGEKTISSLKSIFTGLFSAVSIVIEVVKGVFSVFKTLFGLFAGGSSGSILSFFAKIGDGVTELRKALVEEGGIAKYFEKINEAITKFIGGLSFAPVINTFNRLKEVVQGLPIEEAFDQISSAVSSASSVISVALSGLSSGFDSVKDALAWFFSSDVEDSGLANSETGENVSRFGMILSALGGIASGVFNAFKTMLSGLGKFGGFVANIGSAIKDALGEVWSAISEAIGGANAPSLDGIFKVLAGGAIAAIAAALVNFAKNGFKIDFGQFELLDQLADSFHEFNGVMKAMQKDIIAGALVKIAVAIGILTLSLIALSFVDGAELAKSMGAVAAGLGLLVAALAGLDKIASGEASSVKIAALAVALALVAGAMLLLAMAATLMATADPDTLTIGLLGMLAALEMIGRVMERLTENTDGLVKAAFAVGVLGGSMLIMALALRVMGGIDLVTLGVGLGGTALALVIISKTMGKMPADGMVKAAFSIGLLSLSLMILARAIKDMSDIGLVDTAVGLSVMAISLKLVGDILKKLAGPDVLKAGAAILLVSFGVKNLAAGVERLGSIDFGTLVKGMGAMAVLFLVIGKAMNTAKQSLGGGAALLLVSVAIYGFALAVERMAAIPFFDLIKGLGAVMLSMAALAGLSYVLAAAVPILAALGAGLALIGLAAAGFGAGVYLVARGISILAQVGPKGVAVFLGSLDDLLAQLPKVALALGKAALTFVTGFLSGFDELIPMVVSLLGKLLEAIKTLVPQFLDTAGTVIKAFLSYITTLYPAIVQAGWDLLLAFLGGIRDNIGELASTAIGILTEFITAMSAGIPDYVRAMVELWTTVLTTMAYELGILITTLAPSIGMALIDGIMTGLSETGGKVLEFFTKWIGEIIDWVKSLFGIKSPSTVFSEIGTFLIDGLLGGIMDTVGAVVDFFTNLIGDILGWIGDTSTSLFSKGWDMLVGFHNALVEKLRDVTSLFTSLIGNILSWLGDTTSTLLGKGRSLLGGMLSGLREKVMEVMRWFQGLVGRIIGWIGKTGTSLWNVGVNLVIGLWNGIKTKFINWMKGKLDWLWNLIPGWVKSALGINSPSKVMYDIGKWIPVGLGMGVLSEERTLQKASEGMGKAITDGFSVDEKAMTSPIRDAINSVIDDLGNLDEFSQPVIRPVLDLTDVNRDAKTLGKVLDTSAGLSSALSISEATRANAAGLNEANRATEIKYEQIINAPTALSTNDIYRQTRSLIAITKEEANIP